MNKSLDKIKKEGCDSTVSVVESKSFFGIKKMRVLIMTIIID